MSVEKRKLVSIRREDFDRFLQGQGISLDEQEYVLLSQSKARKDEYSRPDQLRDNAKDRVGYSVLSFKQLENLIDVAFKLKKIERLAK